MSAHPHRNPNDAPAEQQHGSSPKPQITDPSREVRLDHVQLRASVCEHCGHSLDGLALQHAQVRCPECGGVFHAALKLQEFSRRERASRRPTSRSLVIWTTMLVFIVLIAGQFGHRPFLASLAFAACVIVITIASTVITRAGSKP